MVQPRTNTGRNAVVFALLFSLVALLLATVEQGPASAAVSAVQGSAYGYTSRIGLFGGPPAVRPCADPPANTTGCAPAPTVMLPPSGSAVPVTASAPTGDARYGPGIFFTSGPITLSTQGTTGATGSVTTSSNIGGTNTSGAEVFSSSNVASTCTANESGVTGSTTITNGTLRLDDGDATHPEVTVPVPTNPAPNTKYNGILRSVGDTYQYIFNEQIRNPDGSLTVNAGHQIAVGPTAVGDLYFGHVVCGVTATVVTTTTTIAATTTTVPATTTTTRPATTTTTVPATTTTTRPATTTTTVPATTTTVPATTTTTRPATTTTTVGSTSSTVGPTTTRVPRTTTTRPCRPRQRNCRGGGGFFGGFLGTIANLLRALLGLLHIPRMM